MKKVILLATAFMFVTGVALADKGKKKRSAKGKSCCTKDSKTTKASCCADKEKTAKM